MMTNDPLMVGYLESWSDLSITQAAEAVYTGIVLAFGSIAGITVETYQNSFQPDNGSDGTVERQGRGPGRGRLR